MESMQDSQTKTSTIAREWNCESKRVDMIEGVEEKDATLCHGRKASRQETALAQSQRE